MRYSENWVTWKTNVGPGTCMECLSRDKKIFAAYDHYKTFVEIIEAEK